MTEEFELTVSLDSPEFSLEIELENNITVMPKLATTDPASTWEKITGDLNGVNTDFTLPHPYNAGKLALFFNASGPQTEFTELDPSAGTFRMGFAPPSDAIISAMYV